MAYHLIIPSPNSPGETIFDLFLGSATTLDTYWESVGRELGLPVISSLTELADSEEGLTIENGDLTSFKKEVGKVFNYWLAGYSKFAPPENFFGNIELINEAIDMAMREGLQIMIC